MEQIIFKKPDGSLALHTKITDNWSVYDFIEVLYKLDQIPADYEVVGVNLPLPETHEWFDAWTADEDKKVIVDKTKAVQMTKERLRREREPKLLDLDIQSLKALELGDSSKVQQVLGEKQRLLDITELATEDLTLDELKALVV